VLDQEHTFSDSLFGDQVWILSTSFVIKGLNRIVNPVLEKLVVKAFFCLARWLPSRVREHWRSFRVEQNDVRRHTLDRTNDGGLEKRPYILLVAKFRNFLPSRQFYWYCSVLHMNL